MSNINNASNELSGSIPDGWKDTVLGEICKVGDGAHSKVKRTEVGILYLTAKNFNRGALKLDKVDYISMDDYNKLFPIKSRAVTRVMENDVLMGIIGSFGNAYRYKQDDMFGISSSVAILRPNSNYVNSIFLELYLNSILFRKIHQTYSSGSVQGYSNIPTIKTMPITLPPLKEQKAIAAVLTSFDDKIELLQQQNKTLENTAQTIFKEWFGKYQVGDDLPEGWRVGKLENILDLQGGFVHNTKVSGKTVSKIAKMGVVNGVDWFNRKSVLDYSLEIPEKHKLNEDDLVICTRDVTQDRIIIGNVSIVPKDLAKFGLYAGSNTWIVRTNFNKLFLFLLFRTRSFRNHIIQSSKGSTIIMITKDAFLSREVIIPTDRSIEDVISTIKPTFRKIKNNSSQIQSLTKTRDTLLPKLMSGEVRVNEFKSE